MSDSFDLNDKEKIEKMCQCFRNLPAGLQDSFKQAWGKILDIQTLRIADETKAFLNQLREHEEKEQEKMQRRIGE